MYTEIALNYLNDFSNKNLSEIESVLSESVALRDWDAEAFGKRDVTKFMSGLFEKFESINFEVHNIFDCRNTVIVEMTLTLEERPTSPEVENTVQLFVTDIITFDESNKIESIRAYLG